MLTYMNPAAERLLGWTAEELLGRSMHDNIHYKHPDDSAFPVNHCPLLRVQREGSPLKEHEDVFVRKDGSFFPVACSSAPLISEGAFAGVVVVFRDVTLQKQAEQELRCSERRYRALADTMPQIVWAARPDGCLDYFNRRWYEFSGYPEGQSGDSSWLPILHPDDVEPCLKAWHEALQSGEPYEIEYRFMDRATGTYRWHLGRALPVCDDGGWIEHGSAHAPTLMNRSGSNKSARSQRRQGPVPGDAGSRTAEPSRAAAEHAIRIGSGRNGAANAWRIA